MTATRSLAASIQDLGRMALAGDAAALPDAELVGRFAERRDEAAFTALVRRHGKFVLGVCRRVLRHEQDAEDAFQATFLVLARNAASVRQAGAVGNWLYGVAHNVARKARTLRLRRENKERDAAAMKRAEMRPECFEDWKEILDGELSALPDKYRTPIVLCDLLGLTTNEAATQVGCPPKTLGTRLSRGRSLLAARLTRRGVALSAGALTLALASQTTAAAPPRLVSLTVQSASNFASVSPAVAALAQGVMNVMLPKSVKYLTVLACGVLAVAGLSAAHLGGLSHKPIKPVVASVPDVGHTDDANGSPKLPPVRQPTLHDHLYKFHAFIAGLFGIKGYVPNVLQVSDARDKAALSGVWVKKDGEPKIEFPEKDVMKVVPHGDNKVIVILCKYTIDKDGLVKAEVTAIEGKDEAKEKAKSILPVGSEFTFKWKVKDKSASLSDLKGEKSDFLKAHLQGDFEEKK